MLIIPAGITLLLASFAASCNPPPPPPPGISVTFSKTPARGTTTVTVKVSGFTVEQTTVRLDSVGAAPVASSSAASFSFPLDTTKISDGVHQLFVSSQTTTEPLADRFPFSVDNSPTVLPPGFQQSTVFKGLTQPTAVRFSPDGRVFVAEKAGIIKVFASPTATTATVFADLRTQVYSAYDHGLLGLALDPDFPTRPDVYVLYTLDAPIGGTPPVWNDSCPSPPGPDVNGCVVSARLSRLRAAGSVMSGSESVLINDWCVQFTTHTIGSLVFGADGALYASAGDGAGFVSKDYGQSGAPRNPCGDPPVGVGGTQTPPTAEGGALRSQDLVTPTDPATLDGTIIRVNRTTGLGLPGNPNAASPDANTRRIVAFGFRNPFRMTLRPGTNELWIGDVGWKSKEEINRLVDPKGTTVENFGWPCYEGTAKQAEYSALNLNLCKTLYASGAALPPAFSYGRGSNVIPNDGCPTGGASVSGGTFAPTTGGTYPARYRGALFFADYTRRCIFAMLPGANGVPDPTKVETFATGTVGAYSPVDLVTGPGGDLYYVDLLGGTIRRIRYYEGNRPPVAVLDATTDNGPAPLTVDFDAQRSTDADADLLAYSWDLDGDGVFGDSASATPSFTYQEAGNYTVSVRVSDQLGAQDVASTQITAGNSAPVATITEPTAAFTWGVGTTISFSGGATDAQDGNLPASALSWNVEIAHCPTVDTCHIHPTETYAGVGGGSFVAQDHEYPSHLVLTLTAVDSGGLTDSTSIVIHPQTNVVTLASEPAGAILTLGGVSGVAPLSASVITGGVVSVGAPDQAIDGVPYLWTSWSDGGDRAHDIVADGDTTVTATFAPVP